VIPGSPPSFAMAPGVRSGMATKVGNFMSNITTFDQMNILADRIEARSRDMEVRPVSMIQWPQSRMSGARSAGR
jgi:hypothetical protein